MLTIEYRIFVFVSQYSTNYTQCAENKNEVIPEGAYITVPEAKPDEHGKIKHIGFAMSCNARPIRIITLDE